MPLTEYGDVPKLCTHITEASLVPHEFDREYFLKYPNFLEFILIIIKPC